MDMLIVAACEIGGWLCHLALSGDTYPPLRGLVRGGALLAEGS
jgi:hypothetical protein